MMTAGGGGGGASAEFIESVALASTDTLSDESPATYDLQGAASVEQGDLAVLSVMYGAESPAQDIAPTGYTLRALAAVQAAIEGATIEFYIVSATYTRIVDAEETEITFAPNDICDLPTLVVSRFRGLSYVESDAASGASGNPDPPAIATVQAGDWMLAVGFTQNNANDNQPAPPAGYTFAGASIAGAEYQYVIGLAAAYRANLPATAENPGAFTTSAGTDPWLAHSVLLRPA